jgi:poly(hydroxyalkanoate) depolymerase family esterase
MTNLSHADMIEATRLTRAGRLADATALLQRLLHGRAAPDASLDAAEPAADFTARRAPLVIDLAPKMVEVGDPQPPSRAGASVGAGGNEHTALWTKGTAQPAVPEAIRGFLDRIGQLGSAPGLPSGLDGLVGPMPAHTPAPLPDGARFETLTYANAAGSRAYKLYIPSGYKGQPAPLVVMLHGCTQSPDDFAAGTRMNALAEEQTFLVAYPAQAPSANHGKCWNWFKPGDQRRDQGEPSIIAGITRRIMRDYAVDPGRVFVAGLSAGGAAAAVMGAAYPDLYAAIGVHSGLACGVAQDLPSALAAMRQGGHSGQSASRDGSLRPVPTIVFHGDRDATVSPVNGDQVIAQSKAGADLRTTESHGRSEGGTAYTRKVQSDEGGRPILEQWVLHGAGHAWSGGSPAGSYTDPRGPDASREMLRFFLEQTNAAASVN